MRTTFDTARAEALFASALQSSDQPSTAEVRDAVTNTLLALGLRGCAARVAAEFGDHPETAATRMHWAISTIGTI
ncbi:hypothetical protein ACQPZX_27995 [Actinoplanes sp. CA-142083]|uniref:hypothetical protein n=1 Tax=Actinoplanes sp. CA-142083 TaxID=3239903 RepID=UPI003D8D3168